MFRQLKKLLALIDVLESPICSCKNTLSLKVIIKRAIDKNCPKNFCCEIVSGVYEAADYLYTALPPDIQYKIEEIRKK